MLVILSDHMDVELTKNGKPEALIFSHNDTVDKLYFIVMFYTAYLENKSLRYRI